jgi:ACR3 family arsenite efflux pump ArsB
MEIILNKKGVLHLDHIEVLITVHIDHTTLIQHTTKVQQVSLMLQWVISPMTLLLLFL